MALGDGIRRNVAMVSQEERSRLRDAIIALQRRSFPGTRNDRPVGGVTFWFKQDEIHQATHVHGGPAFLTWHREITNRFEALLREVDPMVSLHYWDWQTDPRHSPDGRGGFVNLFTPEFMGAASGTAGDPWLSAGFYNPNANPFRSDADFNPNDNPFDPPRTLERAVGQSAANPDGTPDLGASDAQAIQADSYPSMHNILEGIHGKAHGYIGGTLGAPHRSFRDPFVFLLHSNVDRLFALWQLQPGHPERLDPERVYGSESNTVAQGREVGILTPMEPWAGIDAPGKEAGVIATRPWAPPENEQLRPENQKNSKHPSVVAPPRYDTSLRDCFLASLNFRTRVIRHQNSLGELTEVTNDQDAADARFSIRPGLADDAGVSFESVNKPTFFLRHQDSRLKLQQNSGDDLFKQDATFLWRPGLASMGNFSAADQCSFESFNFPGLFIRHRDFHLFIENSSVNPDSFNGDATFGLLLDPPKEDPGSLFPPWF